MASFLDFILNPMGTQKKIYDSIVGAPAPQSVYQPMQSVQMQSPLQTVAPAPLNRIQSPVAPAPTQTESRPQETLNIQPSVSEEELNEIYNPAMQSLDRQMQSASLFRDDSQKDLQGSTDLNRQRLGDYLSQSEEDLQSAQTTLSGQKDNAIAQARRLYNELQNKGLTRFGTGSSAGGAFSEIVGRETASAVGQAENNFSLGYQQTLQQGEKLRSWFNTESRAIDEYQASTQREIQRLFREDVDKIESKRGELASLKAQQKIEALKEARQASQNLALEIESYKQKLSLEAQAQDKQLQSQISGYMARMNQAIQSSQSYGNNISSGVNNLSQRFDLPTPYGVVNQPSYTGLIQNSDDEDQLFFA